MASGLCFHPFLLGGPCVLPHIHRHIAIPYLTVCTGSTSAGLRPQEDPCSLPADCPPALLLFPRYKCQLENTWNRFGWLSETQNHLVIPESSCHWSAIRDFRGCSAIPQRCGDTTRGRPVHTWCQTVRQGLSGRFSEKVELAHTPQRHNFHKFSNKDVGWTCTSACPSRHKITFPRVNLAPFQKGRQVDFHGFSLWWCQVRFGEGMVSLIRSSNGTCGSTSFVEIASASFCNAVEGSDDLELGMISNPQPW